MHSTLGLQRSALGTRSPLTTRSILALALLTFAAGLAVGAAAGLEISLPLLVAATAAPFILLLTFARPHWAVAVYAVLVYADLLSILVQYHGMPPLARFAGAALLAAVVGYRLVYRRQGLVSDSMTWWLIAYGAVVALGLLYARSPALVMPNVVELIRNFLTYLVIVNAITTPARLKVMLMAVLTMGAALAALTVVQTVTHQFSNDFGGLAQYRVSQITGVSDAPRPGGTLGDANFYGQSLLVLLPLGLFLLFRGKSARARTAGFVASALLIAGVIFTYSRGDAVALGVVLLAAVIYKRPRPAQIAGGLIVVALLIPLLPPSYLDRLTTVVNLVQGDRQTILTEDSIRGRAGAVQAAIGIFLDHPLVGVGRENYPLYELQYLSGTDLAKYARAIPPHDLYLEVATESGLLGIAVVGGILLLTFGALKEARKRFIAAQMPAEAELAGWLTVGLIGYLATSLFLHGAYIYLLWLQVAFIIALRQISRTVTVTAPAARAKVAAVQEAEGPLLSPSSASTLSQAPDTTELALLRDTASAGGIAKGAAVLLPGATEKEVEEASGAIAAFWRSNGGVDFFGRPVSALLDETKAGGDRLLVQYFDCIRLEYRQPSGGMPAHVRTGRLGIEAQTTGSPATLLPKILRGPQGVFTHNGTKVSTPQMFFNFWARNGGMPIFGYPVSPVLVDMVVGGRTVIAQYFECARFEYHPEYGGTLREVQLAPLGAQLFAARYGDKG